jgi:hypothetical protein
LVMGAIDAAIGAFAQVMVSSTSSPQLAPSPLASHVTWVAPPTCLTEAELRSSVEKQLHQAPESLVRHVDGHADVGEAEIVVVFEVSEGGMPVGRRTLRLEPGDCRAQSETISFVLTLVLEGGKVDEPSEPEPPRRSEPETPKEPAISKPKPAQERVPARPPQQSTREWLVSLGASARPFLLPSAGFAFSADVGVRLAQQWVVSIGGNFQLPESVTARSGESVQLSGGGASLEGCYLLASGSLRWGPCVDLFLDFRVADGAGFAVNRRATTLEPQVIGALRLEYPISRRIFLRGLLGAGVALEPHHYVSSGALTLFSQSQFFPFVGISIGATLTP